MSEIELIILLCYIGTLALGGTAAVVNIAALAHQKAEEIIKEEEKEK